MVILIGNSDNKLTQSEWAHYCAAVRNAVERHAFEVHFSGGSDWDAPWQNACWVIKPLDCCDELEKELENIRKSFRQDSIAIMYGETKFI